MNDWQSIWNNRVSSSGIDEGDLEKTFLYLKDCMGISSATPIDFMSFREQFEANLKKMDLLCPHKPQSFFEVGCGSGAYLYFIGIQHDKCKLGGVDYSTPLIETAKKVLCPSFVDAIVSELYCAEAMAIDVTKKYDCVFSRSVFQYFPSREYGLEVVSKMMEKANCCVCILDVFDLQKRDDFIAYRKSVVENYEEKYASTPHQFYAKEDFLRFAEQYNCDVLFARDPLKGYWNEPFVFDVYLYKRG